ncbi:hypothetical protein FPS14_contig00110-0001 [Flavobacterium psychrophilum]|nr:hypothetical protein FPS14_contig00110-0001 [Flavobacterium psychrophilum]
MKAIHNPFKVYCEPTAVGNYKLKYNFESNSQPYKGVPNTLFSW